MPASPPAAIEAIGVAAQPVGWFVDYHDGNALEVACWGLLLGGIVEPMVFNQTLQKLVNASSIGSYTLFHSASMDSIATLIDLAEEPGAGPMISLGGMHSRKSSYVIANPGVTFSITLMGSLDNDYWFNLGTLTSVGVESEVLKTIHYVQAIVNSVSGGPVTVRLAWS